MNKFAAPFSDWMKITLWLLTQILLSFMLIQNNRALLFPTNTNIRSDRSKFGANKCRRADLWIAVFVALYACTMGMYALHVRSKYPSKIFLNTITCSNECKLNLAQDFFALLSKITNIFRKINRSKSVNILENKRM